MSTERNYPVGYARFDVVDRLNGNKIVYTTHPAVYGTAHARAERKARRLNGSAGNERYTIVERCRHE